MPDAAHMSREAPSALSVKFFGGMAHFQPAGPLNVGYETPILLKARLCWLIGPADLNSGLAAP